MTDSLRMKPEVQTRFDHAVAAFRNELHRWNSAREGVHVGRWAEIALAGAQRLLDPFSVLGGMRELRYLDPEPLAKNLTGIATKHGLIGAGFQNAVITAFQGMNVGRVRHFVVDLATAETVKALPKGDHNQRFVGLSVYDTYVR
ncbi:MAG: hypothetical protein ACKVPX_05955 [Myxococcaceae bacterium]